MWPWLFALAVTGVTPLVKEGLPAAPFDIEVGRQIVALRAPLITRTSGARLVLYVRDLGNLGVRGRNTTQGFESAVPEGSVTAYLTGADGEQLKLEHTGYSFYLGYSGLVLTEVDTTRGRNLYRKLELQARIPLKRVRLIWLDRAGRRVQDIAPSL